MGAKQEKGRRGLGLEDVGDLSSLLNPADAPQAANGRPLELALDLIDEDPKQPRDESNPGFTKESIAEIGGTIKVRGVKTPISVRENPDSPGRYIINDGARRYRGSKWAEKIAIPVFIDNDFVPDDQVVANIQREGHTPMELARLIQQRLAQGLKKGEIAKAWGKSAAYITQHAALLNMPEVIANAFNSGRVSDVTVVNELISAHKKAPEEVESWLEDDSQDVTRSTVKLLREYLEEKAGNDDQEQSPEDLAEQALRDARQRQGGGDIEYERERDEEEREERGERRDSRDEHGREEEEESEERGAGKAPSENDPTKFKRAIVQVEHDGRVGRLMLDKRPSTAGLAWLKYDDDGHEFETDLSTVKLIQLIEG